MIWKMLFSIIVMVGISINHASINAEEKMIADSGALFIKVKEIMIVQEAALKLEATKSARAASIVSETAAADTSVSILTIVNFTRKLYTDRVLKHIEQTDTMGNISTFTALFHIFVKPSSDRPRLLLYYSSFTSSCTLAVSVAKDITTSF